MDIYRLSLVIIAAYLVHYFYGNISNLRPLSQKLLVRDRVTCIVHILFSQKCCIKYERVLY